MYRLLIVEDEKWEREGLRDFLDWDSLGIEVADCACNGAEGLKMAELYRPEIILTDVMMPKMDGIRMSESIRAFLPNTKIVILSGYDDFQYAKQSFSFHAFSYLLKPIEKKSIEEVLFNVLKDLNREKSRNEEIEALKRQWTDYVDKKRNHLLLDLLECKTGLEYIHDSALVNGLNFDGRKVIAVMSLFDCRYGEIPESLSPEAMNGLCDTLGEKGIVYSISKTLKEAVLCMDAPVTQHELEEKLIRLMEELRNRLGIEAIVGVGETADDFTGAPKSYVQALEAGSFRFLAEFGEIIPYEKIKGSGPIKQEESESSFIKISSITRKIAYSIQKGDTDRNALLLDNFLSVLRENPVTGKMLIAGFFSEVLNSLNILPSSETPEDKNVTVWDKKNLAMDVTCLDSLAHTRQYLICFLKDITSHIKAKGSCSEFEIVKRVIGMIEARYSEDLDLTLLSQEIHLSPYYIGSIFKRFTGKVFSQYLNDYRIDTAKEILLSKKVKMNNLGETVGIRNTSYFCALFKSRFGISPGEFREILKGGWKHV